MRSPSTQASKHVDINTHMDMNLFRKSLASNQKTLKEASYQILHSTIYSAFQTALAAAKKQGYEISDDEEFNKITTARKPDAGKHLDYHLELTKNGKPQKKLLHIQIYKMESGRFELNFYIQ